jgi:Uncharacterized protein conserved in bacteria
MAIDMDAINTLNPENNLRYLNLLSRQYPTIQSACTEIINLQAILNLPKGTEHFLSDVHGEYESFTHMLKNASGVIKRKIDDVFSTTLTQAERKSLATLIYYPEQKIEIIKKTEANMEDWYCVILHRLVELCRVVSSKYTRSKVRKALPRDFQYIIEELLNVQDHGQNKEDYYAEIIKTIIEIDNADAFIIALCKLIQRLSIDRLHIVGDIFDRGPGPDIILDALMQYHSIDIQWGNHDILWMGAAAGSDACIANVLRISARYANLDTIEDGYGINLLPLATFALEFYKNDDCKCFKPRVIPGVDYSERDIKLISKMHKAISIIQFKLEGEIIKRRPEFKMDDRLLTDKINHDDGTVSIGDSTYKLRDINFPTVDPKNPYALTGDEKELIEKLRSSFVNSEKLQRHIRFLYAKGSIYKKFNSNLLYHGCIPMNADGSFRKMNIEGSEYSGRNLIDKLEQLSRQGYFSKLGSREKLYGMDIIWYLWSGPDSPMFGKMKMTTFERYFISDSEAHREGKNPYYELWDSEDTCSTILKEFKLDPQDSHIICGHIPVRTTKGESPIKANGKLIVIDGGFSRAYQPETGIAGYTLIYNSYGLSLTSHEPFESVYKAIEEEKDILSSTTVLEKVVERKKVADTDTGMDIKRQIAELGMLLAAYRKGLIKET